MVELDSLRAIADDLSKSEWCMGLSAALHKTLEDIERETEDISGYESDVLAWVEKNGGLDAVKERTMPEGMEWLLEVWPKWSNGEYCKFGDWWVSNNYGVPKPKRFRRLSIYTPEQLDEWGQGDGESYDYEWDFLRPADPKYRPDKVEPPAPKVLDADGVEIREGDTVYLLPGKWCGEYPLLYYNGGDEMVVKELDPGHELAGVLECAGDGKCTCFPLPRQLTHTKPEIDTWERIEEDAGCTATKYNERRGTTFTTKQQVARDLVRRAKKLAGDA